MGGYVQSPIFNYNLYLYNSIISNQNNIIYYNHDLYFISVFFARKEGCIWLHSGNCEHSITVTESRAELTVEFPEDTSNEECETIISESLQKTNNSKGLTVECKLKNSRRKRSTFAKFLVSIILIDEKPTEKDEINDTVFNDDIVLISEKDYLNNIEFDLGEILKEALTITQRDSNMTLNFNVEEIKIFEEETKQVIINTGKIPKNGIY